MKSLPWLVLLIGLAVVASKVMPRSSSESDREKAAAAYRVAQIQVQRQCSIPGSGRWSDLAGGDSHADRLPDGSWRCSGWVDVVAMGTPLRRYWSGSVDAAATTATLDHYGDYAGADALQRAAAAATPAPAQTASGIQSIGGSFGRGHRAANPLDRKGY